MFQQYHDAPVLDGEDTRPMVVEQPSQQPRRKFGVLVVRIAYLTTDEVKQQLAEELGQAYGFTLDPLAPKDKPLDGRFDAVIYDLDFLPAREREQILSGLLADPSPCPVAVHSYQLGAAQVEALQAKGIAVHRRLEPETFQALCQAAEIRDQ